MKSDFMKALLIQRKEEISELKAQRKPIERKIKLLEAWVKNNE